MTYVTEYEYQDIMQDVCDNVSFFFDSIYCPLNPNYVELRECHGPGSPLFAVVHETDLGYQYSDGYSLWGYDVPNGESNGSLECEILVDLWREYLPELIKWQDTINRNFELEPVYFFACDEMYHAMDQAVQVVADKAAELINAIDDEYYIY